MKSLIALLICLFVFDGIGQTSPPSLESLRQKFYKASQSESDADGLLELVERIDEQHPVHYGYRAMAEMLQAKYSYNPFSKLKYFNRGKDRLERAVALAPTNVELRFLRFAVQAKAPALLGYKDHLEEDKALLFRFVEEQRRQPADADLLRRIVKFLRECDICSDSERSKLTGL